MNPKTIIEGLLFAAGEDGLSLKNLSCMLELSPYEVESFIHEIRVEWKEEERGFQIIQVSNVYKMTTLKEHRSYLEKMKVTETDAKLSRSSLETLSIIAYKQPVTRIEIEEIRGIKSERTLHMLQRKGLIEVKGRSESLGRPILFGTTDEFLDYFGLNTLEDLPTLEPYVEKESTREESYLFERLGMTELINEGIKKGDLTK